MNQAQLIGLLERFHELRVLVVGDVMLDRFVYGAVARVSPEAPIPVLDIERTVDSAGGAANVMRNVAAAGAHGILVGVVGEDAAAADLHRQLAEFPRIEAELVIDRARPTILKTRFVADGQQMLRADREVRAALPLAIEAQVLARIERSLPDADVVILSDYAKGVLSPTLTREVITKARAAAKPVLVDPKARDLGKYAGATVLTPNRHELANACGLECTGDEAIESAARAVLEAGVCETLVVTRGKEGLSIVERARPAVHLRTAARQVFDVSGAGDTVVALLALGLAGGADLVAAAQLANLAAGIVVGKVGTATVTVSELIEQLAPLAGDAASKIHTLERVQTLVRAWREAGARIAFTNGCFDLLHPGHVSLLDQARRSADRLVVGLNSDESIRRLKGDGRPIQSELARASVLSALKFVDALVIFTEDTPLELIRALEPDVLVKGADYRLQDVVGADLVLARGGRVLLVELLAGQSTTSLVRRAVGPG